VHTLNIINVMLHHIEKPCLVFKLEETSGIFRIVIQINREKVLLYKMNIVGLITMP
jgi:hypothetical protein